MRIGLVLALICLIVFNVAHITAQEDVESKNEILLLSFKGYTSITGYGKGAEEVVGEENIESVAVTYEYEVFVNLSINFPSLNRVACSSILNVSSISITIQPENRSFQPPSTPFLMETDCSSEPYVLLLRNGTFDIAKYPSTYNLQGFTRMDVDTAHYVFQMKIIMFNESRDQIWNLYIEPLTRVPVLVSFEEQIQVDGGDSLVLHSVVYLENPRGVFRRILSRDVYDFLVDDIGVSGSLVIIHPFTGDSEILNVTIEGNNTLLVKFSKPKTCFAVINTPEEVNIESLNIEMNTYLSIGSTIYYSKAPSMCSDLIFTFNKNLSKVFKPGFPEKGVNPRYVPPSIDHIATTLVFNGVASYLAYVAVDKLFRVGWRSRSLNLMRLLRRFFQKLSIMGVNR
ncbi:MAG: hypothetical protein QXF49_04255 [Thermosphaera sp.]